MLNTKRTDLRSDSMNGRGYSSDWRGPPPGSSGLRGNEPRNLPPPPPPPLPPPPPPLSERRNGPPLLLPPPPPPPTPHLAPLLRPHPSRPLIPPPIPPPELPGATRGPNGKVDIPEEDNANNCIQRLQNLSRKFNANLSKFMVDRIGGQDHRPLFRAVVRWNINELICEGTGHSKNEARRMAAVKMLQLLELQGVSSSRSGGKSSLTGNPYDKKSTTVDSKQSPSQGGAGPSSSMGGPSFFVDNSPDPRALSAMENSPDASMDGSTSKTPAKQKGKPSTPSSVQNSAPSRNSSLPQTDRDLDQRDRKSPAHRRSFPPTFGSQNSGPPPSSGGLRNEHAYPRDRKPPSAPSRKSFPPTFGNSKSNGGSPSGSNWGQDQSRHKDQQPYYKDERRDGDHPSYLRSREESPARRDRAQSPYYRDRDKDYQTLHKDRDQSSRFRSRDYPPYEKDKDRSQYKSNSPEHKGRDQDYSLRDKCRSQDKDISQGRDRSIERDRWDERGRPEETGQSQDRDRSNDRGRMEDRSRSEDRNRSPKDRDLSAHYRDRNRAPEQKEKDKPSRQRDKEETLRHRERASPRRDAKISNPSCRDVQPQPPLKSEREHSASVAVLENDRQRDSIQPRSADRGLRKATAPVYPCESNVPGGQSQDDLLKTRIPRRQSHDRGDSDVKSPAYISKYNKPSSSIGDKTRSGNLSSSLGSSTFEKSKASSERSNSETIIKDKQKLAVQLESKKSTGSKSAEKTVDVKHRELKAKDTGPQPTDLISLRTTGMSKSALLPPGPKPKLKFQREPPPLEVQKLSDIAASGSRSVQIEEKGEPKELKDGSGIGGKSKAPKPSEIALSTCSGEKERTNIRDPRLQLAIKKKTHASGNALSKQDNEKLEGSNERKRPKPNRPMCGMLEETDIASGNAADVQVDTSPCVKSSSSTAKQDLSKVRTPLKMSPQLVTSQAPEQFSQSSGQQASENTLKLRPSERTAQGKNKAEALASSLQKNSAAGIVRVRSGMDSSLREKVSHAAEGKSEISGTRKLITNSQTPIESTTGNELESSLPFRLRTKAQLRASRGVKREHHLEQSNANLAEQNSVSSLPTSKTLAHRGLSASQKNVSQPVNKSAVVKSEVTDGNEMSGDQRMRFPIRKRPRHTEAKLVHLWIFCDAQEEQVIALLQAATFGLHEELQLSVYAFGTAQCALENSQKVTVYPTKVGEREAFVVLLTIAKEAGKWSQILTQQRKDDERAKESITNYELSRVVIFSSRTFFEPLCDPGVLDVVKVSDLNEYIARRHSEYTTIYSTRML